LSLKGKGEVPPQTTFLQQRHRTLLRRMLNLIGGSTEHILDYSRGAALVIVPHVVGNADPVGGYMTEWDSIIGHTGLIVAFGGLSPKNFQIDSGGMGRHRRREWMDGVARAGIRVVNVGPVRTDTDPVIGAEWLAIRPNTDTALMLALAHTLIDEGLEDREFLSRCTVGFDRFAAYLRDGNGAGPRDADWAAPICGMQAQAIRQLARDMAATRTLVTLAYSLQRADHGEQPMWAGIALAAILGQIGLPGGGFGIGYGAMGTKGARNAVTTVRSVPTGPNPTGRVIPVSRISDMLLNPGAEIDFNGRRITYPDVRVVIWAGGNPFHHHQNINRMLAAWQRPETIVVTDLFWTPVARHADIVLPAASALERNDISSGWTDTTAYAIRQAIPPVGAARSDFDIVAGLADRLGCGAAFRDGRDEMGWVRYLYEGMRGPVEAAGGSLPDFDAFWQAGKVELPTKPGPQVAFAAFRADPEGKPLATPSGRIELYSERIAGFGYPDCPGHPVWMEPCEWLGSPLARRFPLHLVSNQPVARLHSQNDPSPHSRAAKTAGRETLRLHPVEAAARGLSDGAVVRVFNERGACLAGLRISDEVMPGVAELPTGAWYDPDQPGQIGTLCRHGNPNVLTRDTPTSSLAQSTAAHTALVQVEAWEGPVPPMRAFDPPEIIADPGLCRDG
jgi:biotin/methionine sulfoxide reductase